MRQVKVTLCATVTLIHAVAACSSASEEEPASAPGDDFRRVDASLQANTCQESASGPDSQASCWSSSTSDDDAANDGGHADAEASALRGLVYSSSALELFWVRQIGSVTLRGADIFRDGSFLATTDGTSYFDAGLMPGTAYRYAIEALASDGARLPAWELTLQTLGISESVGTAIDTEADGATTTAPSVPSPPSASAAASTTTTAASSSSTTGAGGTLSARTSDGQLELSWSSSSDGTASALYDIVDGDGTLLARTTESSWSMPVPVPSRPLLISVYAVLETERRLIGTVELERATHGRSGARLFRRLRSR